MTAIALAAAGIGAALLGTWGWRGGLQRRDRLRGRLSVSRAGEGPVRTRVPESWSFRESRRSALFRGLGADFRRAGSSLGSTEMLLFMVLGASFLGAFVQGVLERPRWTLLAGLFGAYLPYMTVAILARRRLARLERQLADALDSVAAALQSGIALRQSFEIVRLHYRAPIAFELNEILQRVDAGIPASRAFRDSSLLLRLPSWDLFSTTMAAKWDAGGNLAGMLAGLSRRIRDAVRLRRRVWALTSEARFSAAFLFATPYVLAALIWFAGRENLAFLFAHPQGQVLAESAFALQIVGAFWMIRLLRRDDL